MKAMLALADGTTFEGRSFGRQRETLGEIVFNTSMFGYQEILTDPSYAGQIITMANPHIGNVGTNPHDEESMRPQAAALVVRAYSTPSNWRAAETLDTYLHRSGVMGIEGIDTRRLICHLRTHGAQMAVMASGNVSPQALIAKARVAPGMKGRDLATHSSTQIEYEWTPDTPTHDKSAAALSRFRIVAVDYGLKRALLRSLSALGCHVTVVPAWTSAENILSRKPDGVVLTNGPGDPEAVKGAELIIAKMLGKVPLMGICLGCQLFARALGGKTWKMKFGHRGGNHPVKNLSTGKVEITSQNHGFAVDAKSLKGKATITHRNLNDETIEGLSVPEARAFGVQYHPEASPGPHDTHYLFARFTRLIAGESLQ